VRYITPEVLRELLDYRPETGDLIWRSRSRQWFQSDRSMKAWNTMFAGRPALNYKNRIGYKVGNFLGSLLLAHRAAFIHFTGLTPDQVDHINQDRSDNRICNLRAVNNQENKRNQKLSINNTSGRIGVYWCKYTSRWGARIGVGYRSVHLGRFDTREEAVAARAAAEKQYGFHANHGRPAPTKQESSRA
jgi:hypothetical protein